MEMLETKTKTGKPFYMLIDDDGKIVTPVFKYLKHLVIGNKSKNTVRTNCLHLLAFFRYLEDKGFDYLEFVNKKSETNKGAYENLVDYKLFLLYPNIEDKVVPITGIKPVRKDSTVNQMVSSVIGFYNYLSDSGIVGELPVIRRMQTLQHSNNKLNQMFMKKKNAVKNLLSSKVHKELIESISEEDFNLCWDRCTCRRNRIIIGLMYYAGLRVSEVVGLTIYDLRDINKNILYVENSDDNENPDAAVKYDSTGAVVFDDRLRDEIITYMNHDLKGIDTNYLIVNLHGANAGKPMRTDTIRDMVEHLGKKVGFPLHPHMFRHGCAIRMLYAGMDMMEIANKLRHKSIETTAKTYAKYDIKAKLQVQQKLTDNLHQDFKALDVDFDELAKLLREDDVNE